MDLIFTMAVGSLERGTRARYTHRPNSVGGTTRVVISLRNKPHAKNDTGLCPASTLPLFQPSTPEVGFGLGHVAICIIWRVWSRYSPPTVCRVRGLAGGGVTIHVCLGPQAS